MFFRSSYARSSGPDYLILVSAAVLILIGFIMLTSASAHIGADEFNDSYFFIREQFYHFVVGAIAFLVAYFLPHRMYRGPIRSALFLLATLVLAGLVFTPLGFSAGGATRWISLGPVGFQPAELFKLSMVIYLATWLSKDKRRRERLKEGFLPFLIVMGTISGVLMLQRSTSPIIIIGGAALVMYFMSGARLRFILLAILLGLTVVGSVVAFSGYRLERVFTFLHPERDPYNSGYHIIQSTNAIGSGGVAGAGYGDSTVKFSLPEPIGDSIFAVYAEEFGFVGTVFLLLVYACLVIRMFLLTRHVPDMFSKMILVGFGSIIFIQTILNIGAMSGFLPLTGTTLPFMSYGGTSLIVFMTMIGIVANISRNAHY